MLFNIGIVALGGAGCSQLVDKADPRYRKLLRAPCGCWKCVAQPQLSDQYSAIWVRLHRNFTHSLANCGPGAVRLCAELELQGFHLPCHPLGTPNRKVDHLRRRPGPLRLSARAVIRWDWSTGFGAAACFWIARRSRSANSSGLSGRPLIGLQSRALKSVCRTRHTAAALRMRTWGRYSHRCATLGARRGTGGRLRL